MLSALKFDERFPHTDPYFGDMETEIAELRTMTRVTKLRQQIECRQEGAWMMVRDVPDDRSSSGTRKVTTFGRATRSVTRSFTSDVDMGDFLSNPPSTTKNDGFKDPKNEAIVEFPEEFSHSTQKPKSGVEITEIVDNESKSDESEPTYGVPIKTSPTKKTSVVTLGQGNVVLIDPQDSNFKVTGMSKGLISDEPLSKTSDSKKVKKVGFCKTEVHFAPDSGKVNIVETDEKPPSSQVLRRKKKPRKEVQKTTMPKLYFGDSEKEKLSSEKSVLNDETPSSRIEHVFPVIREPSPLLSTSIANQARSVKESWSRVPQKNDDVGHYAEVKRNVSFNGNLETKSEDNISSNRSINEKEIKLEEKGSKVFSDGSIGDFPKTKEFKECFSKEGASFLRNVSPKLSKLISNNMQHEFQQKQREILRKSRQPELNSSQVAEHDEPQQQQVEVGGVVIGKASVVEGDIPVAVNIHVSSDESQMKVKPVKIVAQVRVSLEERKGKVEAGLESKRVAEPVYVNEAKGVTRTINVVREDEKTPKPKSSLTKIVLDEGKERKRTKSLTKTSTLERRKSSTPTTPVRDLRPKKDVPKREVAVVKPMKPAKGSLTRPEPCRRAKATSENLRPFKAPNVDSTSEVRPFKAIKVDSSDISFKAPKVYSASEVRPFKAIKVESSADRRFKAPKVDSTSDSLRPFKAPKVDSKAPKDSAKSKKSKEPLRSFEKVSNGWVGHCIVPVKAAKSGSRVNITTTAQSLVTSSKKEGVKSDSDTSDLRNSVAVRIENKFHTRSSLTSAKQFSLSKEHLKSAKLVKELYKGIEAKPDVPIPKDRRQGDDRESQKSKSIVSRRRLVYEEGPRHVRRDSEQSDDSVIRADEEVRAYMFNSKTKNNEC
uniref:Uncharacterized protein n=1 Tax=Lygus hesperus TaxID=30085 RepID=A0A146LPS2_LYGHE